MPNGYDFEDEACGDLFFICRPRIAPSTIDYYPKDGLSPGWGPSLLVATLKNGAIYRVLMTEDAQGIRDIDRLFGTVNRYRDRAMAPDNRTIYVATDAGGIARSADAGATAHYILEQTSDVTGTNPGHEMQARLLGVEGQGFSARELAQIAGEKGAARRANRASFLAER